MKMALLVPDHIPNVANGGRCAPQASCACRARILGQSAGRILSNVGIGMSASCSATNGAVCRRPRRGQRLQDASTPDNQVATWASRTVPGAVVAAAAFIRGRSASQRIR
jgi:hypothetical protein